MKPDGTSLGQFVERVSGFGSVDPGGAGEVRWLGVLVDEPLGVGRVGDGQGVGPGFRTAAARPWWTSNGVCIPIPE
jgi:hypothetical protein